MTFRYRRLRNDEKVKNAYLGKARNRRETKSGAPS